MKKITILLALCVGFGLGHPTAFAKAKLTWLFTDLAPAAIVRGPQIGQGYADLMRQHLMTLTPEFEMDQKAMVIHDLIPVFRLASERGEGVCLANMFRTPEREAVSTFSRATFAIFPVGLVVEKRRQEAFRLFANNDGQIDLEQYFNRTEHNIGRVEGRAYGPMIDQFFAGKAHTKRIVDRSGADQFAGLLSMIKSGRIGSAFGYAQEVIYLSKLKDEAQPDFVVLPVAGLPPALPAYVGCSKGPVGQTVIDRINDAIDQEDLRGHFMNMMEKWTDPSEIARFRNQAQQAMATADGS